MTPEVYLHRDSVDFRKQINGLTAIVELEMKQIAQYGRAVFRFAANAATN